MSKVTINLVTWNGGKYVDHCLHSVINQTFKDYSVLIIDNGSHDETLELLAERYPQFKVIKHKENLGFAKAHNQAIHWTGSDYILCLNQDVVLAPDYLAELVEFMDAHPSAGAVSGKILRLQEDQQTKYIDTLGLKIFKNWRVADMASGEVDEGQYDIAEEVFGVSGALPLYRRQALAGTMYQQEYFDESFFSYKEDVDLACRLRLAGWENWKVPRAVAYHDRTVFAPESKMTKMQVFKNRRRKSKFANFHSYRNHLYFLVKCLPRLSTRVFLYETVKFLYVLFFEISTLKAIKDLLKNLPALILKRKAIEKNKKITDQEFFKWLN